MIPTGCLAEVGNTGYTLAMAKVMISLPDELLARVDARAGERGSTRSATIRELAEVAFGQREATTHRQRC
jgi:metal-responsive CopG/Arc/MetJ family transcriptional regulator